MKCNVIKGALFLCLATFFLSSCNDDADPSIGGFDVYGMTTENVDHSRTYQMIGEATVFDASVASMEVSAGMYEYPMTVTKLGDNAYGYVNSGEQSSPFYDATYTLDVTLEDGAFLSSTDSYTDDGLEPCTNFSTEYVDTLSGVITIQFDDNTLADVYDIVLTDSLGEAYAKTDGFTYTPEDGETAASISIFYSSSSWMKTPENGDVVTVSLRAFSYDSMNSGFSNLAVNVGEVTWGEEPAVRSLRVGKSIEAMK